MLDKLKNAWRGITEEVTRYIYPSDDVGAKVMRVPHYPDIEPRFKDGEPLEREDVFNLSLPHAWKQSMINKFQPVNKNVKINIISGECRDTETVKNALSKGYQVELICGDKISSKQIREEYESIMKTFGSNFKMISIRGRPPRHGTLFDYTSNYSRKYFLLLEDRHKPDEYYESALIVEDAKDIFVEKAFLSQFCKFKQEGKLLDDESIKLMDTYDNPASDSKLPAKAGE